jgi:hypothetical protein
LFELLARIQLLTFTYNLLYCTIYIPQYLVGVFFIEIFICIFFYRVKRVEKIKLSNSVENEESLHLSVKEAFNRGVVRGQSQSNFFEFFDFIGNPFDSSFLITNQRQIVKSTKVIINKLAERIGACHKNERHLILVGPECSGRSTILKIIENFLYMLMHKIDGLDLQQRKMEMTITLIELIIFNNG